VCTTGRGTYEPQADRRVAAQVAKAKQQTRAAPLRSALRSTANEARHTASADGATPVVAHPCDGAPQRDAAAKPLSLRSNGSVVGFASDDRVFDGCGGDGAVVSTSARALLPHHCAARRASPPQRRLVDPVQPMIAASLSTCGARELSVDGHALGGGVGGRRTLRLRRPRRRLLAEQQPRAASIVFARGAAVRRSHDERLARRVTRRRPPKVSGAKAVIATEIH
jgi:hypothetical protein